MSKTEQQEAAAPKDDGCADFKFTRKHRHADVTYSEGDTARLPKATCIKLTKAKAGSIVTA